MSTSRRTSRTFWSSGAGFQHSGVSKHNRLIERHAHARPDISGPPTTSRTIRPRRACSSIRSDPMAPTPSTMTAARPSSACPTASRPIISTGPRASGWTRDRLRSWWTTVSATAPSPMPSPALAATRMVSTAITTKFEIGSWATATSAMMCASRWKRFIRRSEEMNAIFDQDAKRYQECSRRRGARSRSSTRAARWKASTPCRAAMRGRSPAVHGGSRVRARPRCLQGEVGRCRWRSLSRSSAS